MAKRYLNYDELFSISGDYKPVGTMGRHYVTVSKLKHNLSIMVVGHDSYGVTKKEYVAPGETLGYNQGDVWVVPDPNTIKDPLRRVMLEMKIGKDRLHWVEDIQIAAEAIYGLDFHQLPGCTLFYEGEQKPTLWGGEFCFITRKYRVVGGTNQRKSWGDIYVLIGTDRQKLADFIRKEMSEPEE